MIVKQPELSRNGKWLNSAIDESRQIGEPFEGSENVLPLGLYVFSSEKTGIYGPSAWPDHCSSTTERRQKDRDPRVTGMGDSDPQLDYGDHRPHDRSPQAN